MEMEVAVAVVIAEMQMTRQVSAGGEPEDEIMYYPLKERGKQGISEIQRKAKMQRRKNNASQTRDRRAIKGLETPPKITPQTAGIEEEYKWYSQA